MNNIYFVEAIYLDRYMPEERTYAGVSPEQIVTALHAMGRKSITIFQAVPDETGMLHYGEVIYEE